MQVKIGATNGLLLHSTFNLNLLVSSWSKIYLLYLTLAQEFPAVADK